MTERLPPCRCCGRQMAHRPDRATIVAAMRLGRRTRPLIEVLAASIGEWVPNEALWDAAYGDDRDGGPLTANGCIAVAIHRMKPALALLGLTVEFEPGVGGRGRRLVWIE